MLICLITDGMSKAFSGGSNPDLYVRRALATLLGRSVDVPLQNWIDGLEAEASDERRRSLPTTFDNREFVAMSERSVSAQSNR